MSKTDESGMAFPGKSYTRSGAPNGRDAMGLTKREYFAGQAMQGMLAHANLNMRSEGLPATIAESSVVVADALIAELEKNGPAPADIASGEIG